MTEKRILCISCPVGCEMTVGIEDGRVIRVDGNRCPRGKHYAEQEAVEPMRVLPSSVKVVGGRRPLVSVKTDRPIPRSLIPEAMKAIRETVTLAPVRMGAVLLTDLLGTGANVVATRDVSAETCGDPDAVRAKGEM